MLSKGTTTELLDRRKDQKNESKNRGIKELLRPDLIPRIEANKLFLKASESLFLDWRDSGRNLSTKRKDATATIAAPKKGSEWLVSASNPPIAGPKITPNAKEAPMRPISRTRSCFVVISAIYARAAGIEAAENMPWKNLETKSIVRLPAKPNTKKEAALPSKPIKIMGFLPNLSESMPQRGENKN